MVERALRSSSGAFRYRQDLTLILRLAYDLSGCIANKKGPLITVQVPSRCQTSTASHGYTKISVDVWC